MTKNNSIQVSQKPPLVNEKDYINKLTQSNQNSEIKPNKVIEFPIKSSQSIWQRLVSLYALPEVNNARIDREVNWFVQHPEYLESVQKRAEPYLHLILEEIESKKIPGELALLPVVESAFRPDALSSAQASGLWQFIPSTGKRYGLQQNSWYDGRRDVYASTQAATSYLKELSESFEGDWFLALASYNYGKGNVLRSIKKNNNRQLPTDYWSLKLPKETFNYVPKLMAVAKIFANPDQYNVSLQDIPNEPYFEVVDMDSQLDLHKAAELANTSPEEIIRLNPAFKLWCTAPNGPHRLLIPIDQVEIFRENLANLPIKERVSKKTIELAKQNLKKKINRFGRWSKHRVRRGESLGLLAKRYGTTVRAIRRANHLSSNFIRAGKVLKIPGKRIRSIHQRNKRGTKKLVYTVRRGDSIWEISRRFSVKPRDIYRWNRISSKNTLKTGQKLIINTNSNHVVSGLSNNRVNQVSYTVKRGDTLSEISKKFNVRIVDLKRWNAHTLDNIIKPGERLKVVVDKTT